MAMLSDTLFRVARADGLQLLQRRGEHGARELTSWRLQLRSGASHDYKSPDEETVVVLQEGRPIFWVDGHEWRVARSGVFTERPTALYLPPGAAVHVIAETPMEAVLVSTPATGGGTPALVGPGDLKSQPRGRGLYSREVTDI